MAHFRQLSVSFDSDTRISPHSLSLPPGRPMTSFRSPLQNRVLPTGEIIAISQRGSLMGNRGGRLHDPDSRELGARRWASRRWICCALHFKNRQREVMGPGYTELFFLDEVTALAAGHRPCFECRRDAAQAYARALAAEQGRGQTESGSPPSADVIDRLLHAQRTQPVRPKLSPAEVAALPEGAMIARGETWFALRGGDALRWTPSGYKRTTPAERQSHDVRQSEPAVLLTPPASVSALANGYRPIWHQSAGTP